jgi:hypothetical protein
VILVNVHGNTHRSITLQLVAKNECILDLAQKPFLNAVAHAWARENGDPAKLKTSTGQKVTIPFKGKFPPGTYVIVRAVCFVPQILA